jgi:Fic family protein
MFRPNFRITPAMLTNIEQLGRIMGFLQAVRLPGTFAQELLAAVEAEIVHASTAIEGNTLTQEQVTQVLAGKQVHALARDIQEVKNYQATLVYIHVIAAQMPDFTHQTILELHYRLLEGVEDQMVGRYRTGFVRIGDYLPPEPFAVHALMGDFIAWLNDPTPAGYSPLLYAGIVHYQLVAIHPFTDGNGRTARALTTLYLLKHGYDITRSFALEAHYNRDRSAYYAALHAADVALTPNGEQDFTPWLEYFIDGLLIEAARAESRIRSYVEQPPVQAPPRLTGTQRAILAAASRQPVLVAGDLVGQVGLSRRGIAKAVSQLVAIGLLQREGATRGATYRITEAGLTALDNS